MKKNHIKIIIQYFVATCVALSIIALVIGIGYLVLFHTKILAITIIGLMLLAGLIGWIYDIRKDIYKI